MTNQVPTLQPQYYYPPFFYQPFPGQDQGQGQGTQSPTYLPPPPAFFYPPPVAIPGQQFPGQQQQQPFQQPLPSAPPANDNPLPQHVPPKPLQQNRVKSISKEDINRALDQVQREQDERKEGAVRIINTGGGVLITAGVICLLATILFPLMVQVFILSLLTITALAIPTTALIATVYWAVKGGFSKDEVDVANLKSQSTEFVEYVQKAPERSKMIESGQFRLVSQAYEENQRLQQCTKAKEVGMKKLEEDYKKKLKEYENNFDARIKEQNLKCEALEKQVVSEANKIKKG